MFFRLESRDSLHNLHKKDKIMQRASSNIKSSSARHISALHTKESVKVIQNKEYQRTKANWPDASGLNPPDWRLSIGLGVD